MKSPDRNNTQPELTLNASPRRIAIATIVALLVSAIVLVAVIMPAEFGIDPTGFGAMTGLTELSQPVTGPLERQPDPHRTDYVEFTLEPFQSVEYKYLMDIDAPLIFSWSAETEVYYDFHAEPAGLGEEYAVSYDAGTVSQDSGSFHAPFTGIHGWFWENRGFDAVTVRLYSAGYFVNGTVFQDGGSFERAPAAVFERR